jgi:hypothetical protein
MNLSCQKVLLSSRRRYFIQAGNHSGPGRSVPLSRMLGPVKVRSGGRTHGVEGSSCAGMNPGPTGSGVRAISSSRPGRRTRGGGGGSAVCFGSGCCCFVAAPCDKNLLACLPIAGGATIPILRAPSAACCC